MAMEELLAQFSLLADRALDDKDFDPSTIEDLMELFEQEAYASWSVATDEPLEAGRAAEASMREAEDYLDSLMEAAMADFRRSYDEAERTSNEELSSLMRAADATKKMGHALGAAATTASKKYMEAALASATAVMRSAFASSKVHPS